MNSRFDHSILVVDTETTGIHAADGSAGRLVQLAWVRLDATGREVEARSLIVRPESFVIPHEATAVHGITTERALSEGVSLAEALGALEHAARGVQGVVAHSAPFDRAMIAREAERLGARDPLAGLQWTCTMRAGKPVCRIARPGGWKSPSLEELYRHLFGSDFAGAHEALTDARAAGRCYVRLVEMGAVAFSSATDAAPPPTKGQEAALAALEGFLDGDHAAFVLLGAAGTGKTTLLRHLAARVEARRRPVHLLAPTGRAARVVARHTGREAKTIHSHLYSYRELETDEDDPEASVKLVFGLRPDDEPPGTVFIIDEASMVADSGSDEDGFLQFGSGRPLTDLVRFAALHDRSRGNQVVFVGDPAQLPPVGSATSPALSEHYLAERHGLDIAAFELSEVLRQQEGSGILSSAHRIRRQIGTGDFAALALDEGNTDVEAIQRERAVSAYLEEVENGGFDAAILITRTNKAASALNATVRREWFGLVPPLVERDRLIVVQNNLLHGLFNGDFVEVVSVSDHVERRRPLKGIQLAWREVTVRDGATGREVTALLMDDLVTSDAGNLGPEEVQALVVDFRQRHPNLKPKTRGFEEAFRCDPYVHALRARHGYALTCHKAQGGEWPTAIVVFDGRHRGWDNEDYFRWTYTAITRATRHLVAVRAPRHTATSDVMWSDRDEQRGTAATTEMASGRIEAHLARLGATLTGQENMPYRRRLVLTRDGVVGRVDLVYDGKNVAKAVQPLGSGPGGDLAVEAAEALAPTVGTVLPGLEAAVDDGHPAAFEPPEGFFDEQPHLADLYEQFREALADTAIWIESVAHYQWMERYTFRHGQERAEVDVYYNGKGRFTKAQAARTSALAEEIRERWDSL